MKFYQKLDGGVHVSAREYDIEAATAVTEGQLVKLSGGWAVPAAANETGAILGIAAENHSGAPDALDPRADGKKLLVIDDPAAVMQCAAPTVTQSGEGSATTLTAASADLAVFADGDFTGGYVKLVSKAEESTNADPIGKVRRIAGFAASGRTFTLESGGAPCAGDVYAVFPPIGFAKGGLGAGRDALVLTAAANLPLKVVGYDRGLGKINLIAKKHLFAVDA